MVRINFIIEDKMKRGFVSPLFSYSDDSYFNKFLLKDSEITENFGMGNRKLIIELRLFIIKLRRYV